MAIIIGGTIRFPSENNTLIGTGARDVVFGDRYTTGAVDEVLSSIPQLGGALSQGTGGNDRIEGRGGFVLVGLEFGDIEVGDFLYGDAWTLRGSGRGGNDYLNGNEGYDTLIGDASDIKDFARGGNDDLIGANGPDDIFGDAGGIFVDPRDFFDRVGGILSGHAQGGNDFLSGGADNDNLTGDAYKIIDDAIGGSDRIYGGPGADVLSGDARYDGFLSGRAIGGVDWLDGGTGTDALLGDAGFLGNLARGGDDQLFGRAAFDALYGDASFMAGNAQGGNDRLYGGGGDDLLYGDAGKVGDSDRDTARDRVHCGDDLLIGAEGTDMLFGDFESSQTGTAIRGEDIFLFQPGSGLDAIGDFEQGQDKIDISAYGFTRFANLRITTASGHSVIDLDQSAADVNEITVLGVGKLQPADFIFA